MRRTLSALPAALAVAALAVALAGCSAPAAQDADGFDENGCATSGPASESVKVSGDFGDEPKVEFDEQPHVENTAAQRRDRGQGRATPPSSAATWPSTWCSTTSRSSTELIPYSGEPQSLTLDEASLLPGIVDTLNCAKAGERVVGVVPP